MSYSSYGKFGSCTTPTNYYAVCLDNSIDANFETGMGNYQLGYRSPNCQLLLSEYIANNSNKSDKFDTISTIAMQQKGTGFPNYFNANCNFQGDPSTGFIAEQDYGDYLVDNAGKMKYCQFTNATLNNYLFNPNDPSSPTITQVVGSNIRPVCSVDPKVIDKDILMNKILEQPQKHLVLLRNIYNNVSMENLKGTKLGNFYELNKNYFK